MRYNLNASTHAEARLYINRRALQFARLDYQLESIVDLDCGVEAFFKKDGKRYQSIYILEQFRGQGRYRPLIKETILTMHECELESYLVNHSIPYKIEKAAPFVEYNIIEDFYDVKCAKRSGIEYMNHIEEGLIVLNAIGASSTAEKGYCLHPIAQLDETLPMAYSLFEDASQEAIIAAMEYRSVANEYLSKRTIQHIEEIRISPLNDVNDMLIADKLQNYKDFLLYHKGTHPRSDELEEYFINWFNRLGIVKRIENCKPTSKVFWSLFGFVPALAGLAPCWHKGSQQENLKSFFLLS